MCKWAMKQRKGHVNSTGSKSNIKKNSYFHTKTTYELPFRPSKMFELTKLISVQQIQSAENVMEITKTISL